MILGGITSMWNWVYSTSFNHEHKYMFSTVIQIINNAWNTINTAALYTPVATTYRHFKTHYCKSLREHYINTKMSNTTKKNQAYVVDALTATVDRLQSELNINTQNVSTIANTQDQMLAQPEVYSTHYVPSVVSTTTATTPSGLANSATDQRLDKIESMLQKLMQNQNQNPQRNSN
uniref:Uncharacterized protein n=1 Tax=Pseudo-nitzschia australis TaxID=44445 RepID=A0A7S4ELY3_9STRA